MEFELTSKKWWIVVAILFLAGLYLGGPSHILPYFEPEPVEIPTQLKKIRKYVYRKESKVVGIKPGNKSVLSFYNPQKPRRTRYVLLYLHGFLASPEEGKAITIALQKKFRCNAYIPRLYNHGVVEEEPLKYFNADSLYQSAFEALEIARKLGDSVIIAGTSTGASIALHLAAFNKSKIAGLLLFSPNVRLENPAAPLLSRPWGLQIARVVFKSKYFEFEADEYTKQFWTPKYRLEALVQLQLILDKSMEPYTYERVSVPAFMVYYDQGDNDRDPLVSVPAMLEMYQQLATPSSYKEKLNVDSDEHVVCNPHKSKAYEQVLRSCETFISKHIITQSPHEKENH